MSKAIYKIFNKYLDKKRYISVFNNTILENIEIIAGKDVKDRIKKTGLENMHKVFPVEYVPFLQFALDRKLKNIMYEYLYSVGKSILKFKKEFFIDKTLNFRIVYPHKINIKSKLSRNVFRSLDLNNFYNAEEEIKKAKEKKYIFDNSDITKINYFKTKNNSLYLHSPHRDTWFAHGTKGLNVWLAISKVNKNNGMVLFPDVFKYDCEHEKNPAYIKDEYNLGSPYKTDLRPGELFVFNPEILHATNLNTGDKTRVVFSGRIEKDKPKFYKNTYQIKEPYWINSNDVKNKQFENFIIFNRKSNLANNKKKNLHKNKINKIKFNFDFEKNKNYKIFRNKKYIKDKKIILDFKNVKIGLIKKKDVYFAFNALCPHLNINLLNSKIIGNTITCQGHGVEFNIKNKKSNCGLFKLKKYKVFKKENEYFLKNA